MSEVICLSDSDESDEAKTTKEANNDRDSDRDSEFEFPAVEFYYEVDKSKEYNCEVEKMEDYESETEKIQEDEPEVSELPVKKSSHTKKRENSKKVGEASAPKKYKTIKPGDGLKTIKVCLDVGLKDKGFSFYITEALDNFDISWTMDKLPIADSIKFVTTNQHNELANEKFVIIIWNWDKVVSKVSDKNFEKYFETQLRLEKDPKVMLVLCGMEEYFEAKAGRKESTKRPKNRGVTSFHNAPKITMDELEDCLIGIQMKFKCCNQMAEIPEDLGPIVYRFTKGVSQIPYKIQETEKREDKLNWYAHGNNRDTVKVDKAGNGLARLWQQQLCQFPLASLETAQAIISVYPTPYQLMSAYDKCTKEEGEMLLKDIPIRRAAGPLTTVRKIGPELSKKIFVMFTSKDGDQPLG